MSHRRFILVALAALIAISGALYLSTQRNLPRDPLGMALLPALSHELDTVTALTVRKGSATPAVTVRKQDKQWTVAERADYPADVAKLRKLLLALSDAKIREEKTSNPAGYPIIGVEDPTRPGATGAQLELTAKDGKLGVIVGKPIGEGNFVRRVGENVSYIVEPGISFEAEPRFWIDTHILDLPIAAIQSVQVKLAAGPAYALRRTSPTGAFVLDALPSGRKPVDAKLLAPSPTAFSTLSAEDVAATSGIDFTQPSQVTVTETDGSTITFTGAVSGDKRWIRILAPQDAALTAKATARAFEIDGYRYDAIFRPLEQLLVPKEAPAEAKKPPAKLPRRSAPKP